jgi:hypothetical protein
MRNQKQIQKKQKKRINFYEIIEILKIIKRRYETWVRQ